MPNNPYSFAARLQSLRSERHLSKTALAKSVGVTTTCVWNWEEGNTEPRDDNMLALSKALNVPLEYLESGTAFSESDQSLGNDAPSTLSEAISTAKSHIAELAGIDPEKVRISLEY
jgi:transcriptional regulator with XRE-family HTH domain